MSSYASPVASSPVVLQAILLLRRHNKLEYRWLWPLKQQEREGRWQSDVHLGDNCDKLVELD